MLNFGKQFPFRILFRILSVIVVNCNLIISVMAAWPIKFTEGSKSGKNTPYLSIYLQRIKKPKGRHMKMRGDRGGPLIENGRTKWTNKWRLDIKILIRGIINSHFWDRPVPIFSDVRFSYLALVQDKKIMCVLPENACFTVYMYFA